MLVRFSSKKQSISMHETDAKQMIKMMGMSGAIPSAIDAKSLLAAIAALQQSLSNQAGNHGDADKNTGNNADNNVNIDVRAQPLMQMLKNAEQKSESVMWEYQGNSL